MGFRTVLATFCSIDTLSYLASFVVNAIEMRHQSHDRDVC